jgi:hypothetical protein
VPKSSRKINMSNKIHFTLDQELAMSSEFLIEKLFKKWVSRQEYYGEEVSMKEFREYLNLLVKFDVNMLMKEYKKGANNKI